MKFRRILLLLLVICCSFDKNYAQDTTSRIKDTLLISDSANKINYKKRVRAVTTANILGYGGSMAALYAAWYKDYPQTTFHFFNDNREWNQVDKVGHAYSAYVESRASMELWRYAGLSRKKRIWIGGLSGAAYQTVIEVLDGFSEGWGWSWGDFAANVAGSGMLVAQELAWDEQRILFKFSFHKKNYGAPALNERADQLFGTSTLERMLKDYNGQTYWLSANVRSFFPSSSLPKWFNVAVGYGAEGMFGGEQNLWTSKSGIAYDATNIKRTRQFFLAPDVDLTRIRTKNKLLKATLFVLNSFKFPAPSLELNGGKFKFNWIHF